MLYYAIADLHGRFDLLKEAVNAIEKHSSNSSDTRVITLGDYIDRGPQSKEIIEYLMARGSNWTCLQGNHEAMMVDTIRKPLNPDWWLGNGGNTTVKSYGGSVKMSNHYGFPPIGYDPHVIPPEHVNWIAELPLYYETEHHVFVHAGCPLSNKASAPSLEEQAKVKNSYGEYDMQWMLYGRNDGGWHGDKHVVHGHHQFADGPHEWSGRTDLDTYAWRYGRLVVGVFSSEVPGKAIDYLEILGDDYEGTQDKRVQRPALDRPDLVPAE